MLFRSPPLPPLLVGTVTVAALQTAVTNHPTLLQNIENEKSLLNQRVSQLKATVQRVDSNNKRWFKAWSSNFPPGSPEHNALTQIGTEQGTIAPTAVLIASLTKVSASVQVAYVPGGGLHASSIQLLYQIVGPETTFGHATPVIPAGQTVGPFLPGLTIHFKTRSENSIGSADSPVQTIILTQLPGP